MMARGTKGSKQRPDTLMQDRTSPTRRSLLATHGRTIHWVISGRNVPAEAMSALPPKADKQEKARLVRFVPKRTYAVQQIASLFDHLIGRARASAAPRSFLPPHGRFLRASVHASLHPKRARVVPTRRNSRRRG